MCSSRNSRSSLPKDRAALTSVGQNYVMSQSPERPGQKEGKIYEIKFVGASGRFGIGMLYALQQLRGEQAVFREKGWHIALLERQVNL